MILQGQAVNNDMGADQPFNLRTCLSNPEKTLTTSLFESCPVDRMIECIRLLSSISAHNHRLLSAGLFQPAEHNEGGYRAACRHHP